MRSESKAWSFRQRLLADQQTDPDTGSKMVCRRTIKICCKAEYVQHHVCFVNVQSSLHENVVFSFVSFSARVGNATYIIYIMWNSISGLDACYNFRFSLSCGVAVR